MYGTILKSLAIAGGTGAAVILGIAGASDLYEGGRKLIVGKRGSSSEKSTSKKKSKSKAKAKTAARRSKRNRAKRPSPKAVPSSRKTGT